MFKECSPKTQNLCLFKFALLKLKLKPLRVIFASWECPKYPKSKYGEDLWHKMTRTWSLRSIWLENKANLWWKKKVFIVPFFVNVGVDPRNQTGSMTVAVVIRLWHYDITWQELIINVSSLTLSWSDFSCERETLVLLCASSEFDM